MRAAAYHGAVSRPLDLSALTPGERGVLLLGTAGFVNGMIPWWYRTESPAGTFLYPASLRTLSLLSVICCAFAALVVLGRAWIWPQPAPARDGLIYTALGAMSAFALIAQSLLGTSPWVGLGLGLLISTGLTASGLRRRRERAAGWR